MVAPYTRGVAESEAVTAAAQALTVARANLRGLANIVAKLSPEEKGQYAARLQDASNRHSSAVANYKAAYKKYTNPFGVQKTV